MSTLTIASANFSTVSGTTSNPVKSSSTDYDLKLNGDGYKTDKAKVSQTQDLYAQAHKAGVPAGAVKFAIAEAGSPDKVKIDVNNHSITYTKGNQTKTIQYKNNEKCHETGVTKENGKVVKKYEQTITDTGIKNEEWTLKNGKMVKTLDAFNPFDDPEAP